jgi:N-acetylmuramoyl-L-alanine amidase
VDAMIVEALMCLAMNIYHEARDQPLLGQIAVAEVVINRVNDPRYPNTVCEVVREGPTYKYRPGLPVRHKCQFSWWCDGKSDKPRNEEAWMKAIDVADLVLTDKVGINVVGKSTHYHAYYVRPAWAKTKRKVVRIEDHIFYIWE